MLIRCLVSMVFIIVYFSTICYADIYSDASSSIVQKICNGKEMALQTNKKLAITPFENKVGDGVDADIFQDKLITAFVDNHHFRVVDRKHVNKCLEELRLMAGGLLEPDAQKKLGRLLGADYLLIGTISNGVEGDSKSISTHLVQVETAEVIASSDYFQPTNAKNKKIMIVVPETHITRRFPDPAGETELIKMFTEAGCRVIDQSQYAAIRYSPEIEEAIKSPTGLKARSLTAKYGADILIIGEGISETVAGNINGTINCRARIEVRAVVTRGDAQIMAATDGVGAGADIVESVAAKIALRKAGHNVGNYLLKQLFNIDPPSLPILKPTIAVAPFDNSTSWRDDNWKISQQIPDLISRILVKNRNIEVIDRTNFEEIVKLGNRQISGLYDDIGKSAELGTLALADYLILGKINQFNVDHSTVGTGIFQINIYKATVTIILKVINVKREVIVTNPESTGEESDTTFKVNYADMAFGSADFDRTCIGKATKKAIDSALLIVQNEMNIGPKCPNPNCNSSLKIGVKFCTKCGQSLEPIICKNKRCKQQIEPGDKVCGKCGKKVE